MNKNQSFKLVTATVNLELRQSINVSKKLRYAILSKRKLLSGLYQYKCVEIKETKIGLFRYLWFRLLINLTLKKGTNIGKLN